MRISGRRWWIAGLIALAILVLVAGFARRSWHWTQAWSRQELARRWSAETELLPDNRALPRLTQIAALGDEGIAELVKALASERPVVASAAHQVLLDQLHDWDALPLETASLRRSRLAHELATHPEFPESSAATAAGLAQRLLVAPLDRQQSDAALFVSDCEKVIQNAGRASPWKLQQAARSTRRTPPTRPASAPKPSGRTPPAKTGTPESGAPVSSSPESSAVAPKRGPVRVSISSTREPEQFTSVAAVPESAARVIDADSEPETGMPEVPPPQNAASASVPLFQLPDFEVMRHLQSKNGALVSGAERELRRRGFENQHLDLARRLTHPDPEIRRELATTLPHLREIDPGPWLRQLSQDEEPSVRRVAVAILLTTNDPQARLWLTELDQVEPDERIRKLLRHGRDTR